jgi:hypothetical protein
VNVGDIVKFMPSKCSGTLTAVKYFNRVLLLTGGKPGLVLDVDTHRVLVCFGTKKIRLREEYLEVISECG